jgi:hypothetical protein
MTTDEYPCFDCYDGRVWIKGRHPETADDAKIHRVNKTDFYMENTQACPKCNGTGVIRIEVQHSHYRSAP